MNIVDAMCSFLQEKVQYLQNDGTFQPLENLLFLLIKSCLSAMRITSLTLSRQNNMHQSKSLKQRITMNRIHIENERATCLKQSEAINQIQDAEKYRWVSRDPSEIDKGDM
ncbi:UNKNOWN [Stylonychia lemnae]|uniref:Uncharacterized protein n=1 Tax=Stylonychia lemnae TaxID=5949 RepID=A0A077ZXQ3_STYLE|nr:UNKNOWN [Stylonychia lemnae]|eukprot:CDW74690.1 UNKNOWN [Stylonychia lemnae]